MPFLVQARVTELSVHLQALEENQPLFIHDDTALRHTQCPCLSAALCGANPSLGRYLHAGWTCQGEWSVWLSFLPEALWHTPFPAPLPCSARARGAERAALPWARHRDTLFHPGPALREKLPNVPKAAEPGPQGEPRTKTPS